MSNSNYSETILYPPLVEAGRVLVRFRVGGRASRVLLGVFDVRGRLLRSLNAGISQPGEHQVTWDRRTENGGAAGRGVYFLRLQAPGIQLSRKLVIVSRF